MSERLDRVKALRLHTGAPWWKCAAAIDEFGGVDAALDAYSSPHSWRGTYDGDIRHRCHDSCPPWRFRWLKTDARGHACSTHCQRHPSPHWDDLNLVWKSMRVTPDQATGALSICDWDPAWAVRFLCAAGAAHLPPDESPLTDGPTSTARIRQRFGVQ